MIKTPVTVLEIDGFSEDILDANGHAVSLYDVAVHVNAVTAELTALREFVASLRSLAWEQKDGELYAHGTYVDVFGGIGTRFWIFDSDGNGVASGDNALEAVENFQKLPAGEGGGEI